MKIITALAITTVLALSALNIFFYYQRVQEQPDHKTLEIVYWENFLKEYPNYKDGQKRLAELKNMNY